MIGNCYIVMWILIISLVLLGVIALIAGIIRNKRLQKKIEKGELDRMPEVKEVDVECCGQHEVCERDSLLAAVSKKIEYYDDEELDQFIGKAGDAYTEEETEMFRDVLYTTLDVEVAGWVRSLQLRGIELPDDLKDEVFLIIGERRNIEVKKADGEVLFKGDEWRQVCEKWKKDYPVVQPKHYEQKSPANVYAFIKEESRRLNEGQITVVGNGSACVVGGHGYVIKKGQRFISNSAIASMGYDLPAAIGACVANKRYCRETGE